MEFDNKGNDFYPERLLMLQRSSGRCIPGLRDWSAASLCCTLHPLEFARVLPFSFPFIEQYEENMYVC